MRQKLIAIMLSLFVFPICSFAYLINSPVNQQVTVWNDSSQTILLTDAAAALNNDPVVPGYDGIVTYASDKFTNPKGQTFNHTIKITSAADNKLICTVTSNLKLSTTSMELNKPTSSDPAKCETGTYITANQNGMVLGFQITVKN